MPIVQQLVPTSRLRVHTRIAGPAGAPLVVLVHGNVSTGAFFEPLMESLAERFHVIAPDMRGFGDSEPAPIDATRGVRDFADDLRALLVALDLSSRPAVFVGWSAGGGVIMQYAIDNAAHIAGLVLENPMSPFGFGGSKGVRGTPYTDDFAGSGGGTANPEFARLIRAGDRGNDNQTSPRNVMNAFYFKPPFRVEPALEDAFVAAMLKTQIGDDHYPGDTTASPNWPGVAPGTRGMNNAISAKYTDLSSFARIEPRPPVLWIRGADDQIVSDTSLFDFGFLGKLGAVPGWPGDDVAPPQPMVGQMRAVLDDYAAAGGRYHEEVFVECGHSPHIEQPERFLTAVQKFAAEAFQAH
ncbi:alpha/beta hydrolase [Nannocystis sp. SCPEA4]|uniref:alpha/beta hydrolase n=1 Tax=Nannocystis sp. SCPEA4 TaxID=2996787 RepID=UPI00226FD49E|nr:alpha/beta hydrolase [Nannocystis sp. SCPEA4]MCY1062567.1 alpha/beta hydrolase [Nannocystis sp. SCPEA4]